jgi:hypothetical protein
MYAMQYGFDFPHDFDMGSVRARVAEIGARFDELPGLRHKAFLVADRSGDAAGRYTPFCALWQSRPPVTVTGRVFDVEYLARTRQPATAR